MLRIREKDLPFRGSSYNFVGADHGDVGVSVFLFRGEHGAGPGPHRHPYDEIQFVQEGRGRAEAFIGLSVVMGSGVAATLRALFP